MKEIKAKCFKHPQKRLWLTSTKDMPEVEQIFMHINSLEFEDTPDYNLIHEKLVSIYNRYEFHVSEAKMTVLRKSVLMDLRVLRS